MKSFATLTHAGQTRKLYQLARQAVSRYPLKDAKIKLLQYEDNAVFRIASADGKFFTLRISSSDGYSLDEQRSEIRWLSALCRDTALSVPEPVQADDGEAVVVVRTPDIPEGRQCVLFRWIPGKNPTDAIQPEAVEKIGETTALLHLHARSYSPAETVRRRSWDWTQLFGEESVFAERDGASLSFPLLPDEWGAIRAAGIRNKRAMDDYAKHDGVRGLIHSDLHLGNVLIYRSGVGVIDFDDCGWGFYMLDVATVLSSLYRYAGNEQKYAKWKAAYLQGYEKSCALPKQFEQMLAHFLALRDMVIVNFILASDNEQVLSWGRSRVKGIIGLLHGYAANGAYPGL